MLPNSSHNHMQYPMRRRNISRADQKSSAKSVVKNQQPEKNSHAYKERKHQALPKKKNKKVYNQSINRIVRNDQHQRRKRREQQQVHPSPCIRPASLQLLGETSLTYLPTPQTSRHCRRPRNRLVPRCTRTLRESQQQREKDS